MRISDWIANVCSSDLAETRARLESLIVALQDDVGDAGDRIRPIDRRSAVRNDLESVDRAQRDRRDVDALSRRAIGQPVPIEQRERRVAAETAQIDRRSAADIDAIRPRDIEADAGLLTPTESLRDRASDFAASRPARICPPPLTDHGYPRPTPPPP